MKSNSSYPYFNIHNSRSLRLYRLCFIISKLQYNRNKSLALTIEKLSVFNEMLINNELAEIVLSHFKPEKTLGVSKNSSFRKNVSESITEMISSNDTQKSIIELCNLKIVSLVIKSGVIYISLSDEFKLNIEGQLIDEWSATMKNLSFLTSKSTNQIITPLIGESL
ncbi:hypothetical protein BCS58_14320 [Enterovibrio norvegicus]|uniref:hypothetical protein n=1 Tax=Enterovibrio norvegicus TaxID=188144 RepID=UPI003899D7F3